MTLPFERKWLPQETGSGQAWTSRSTRNCVGLDHDNPRRKFYPSSAHADAAGGTEPQEPGKMGCWQSVLATRSQATRPRTRLPITPQILGQLRQVWELEKHCMDKVMLWAACCMFLWILAVGGSNSSLSQGL